MTRPLRSALPVSSLAQFTALFPFALDEFQQQAVQRLIEGQSVLVSAPTGAGKTVVAEFAVFDSLARAVRTIYTTPLKALSNQKFRDLTREYGEEQVGLVTGDLSIGADRPVLVMTTEILRNILYQDKGRLDDVQYVVLDECHYMNDDQRGTVWEEVLIHCPSHIQIIALSATIPNAEDLAAWITAIHRPMAVIQHDERPVPLHPYYFSEGHLHQMVNRRGDPSSRLARRRGGRGRANDVDPVEVLEILREKEMLPAIYFVFSRRGCDTMLEDCLGARVALTSKEERYQISKIVQETLSANPTLAALGPKVNNFLRALPNGVAVHHAGILPVLKHLIEILFQKNLIKVVFATETLAAGINMPARTTVISSLSKRTDSGHRVLTTSEFAQMTGRAGRRGMDPVGFCVVVDDGYQTAQEALGLVTGTPEPIESHFTFSYNMVTNLLSNFTWVQIETVLRRSYGQYQANREVHDMKQRLLERTKSVQQAGVACPERPHEHFDVEPLPDYEEVLNLLQQQEEQLQQRRQQWLLQRDRYFEGLLYELPLGTFASTKTGRRRTELGFIADKEWNGRQNQWHLTIQTPRGIHKITHSQLKHVYSDSPPAEVPDYPPPLRRHLRKMELNEWVREDRYVDPSEFPDEGELRPFMPHFSEEPSYDQSMADVATLKERLKGHMCQDCPVRWEHQQSEVNVRHLRTQMRKLEDEIHRRQDQYISEFWRYVEVLKALGHLDADNAPTEKGQLTAHIRAEAELLIAQMILTGIFAGLTPPEAAALLSTVVYDGRHHLGANLRKAPQALRRAVERTYRLASDIEYQQRQRGLDRPTRVELTLIQAVLLWGDNCPWPTLVERVGIDDGDLVRSFRQIIDLMHQLKAAPGVPPALAETFKAAITALDRDLVSATI